MFLVAVLPLLLAAGGLCLPRAGDRPGIPRRKIVQAHNVRRHASSKTTPLQVGNGNLAFGADITGLQTFEPFGTLSTWGWHNFSLPTTINQTLTDDFTGLDWLTHGRLVNYNQPNPAEADISQWLIQNPQRLNLVRIGLDFNTSDGTVVTESQLQNATQELDLWTGHLLSSFVYNGSAVEVETWAHPEQDMLGITVRSDLLASRGLGLFFDFPFPDTDKFDAPFVGRYTTTGRNSSSNSSDDAASHSTDGYFDPYFGRIQHAFGDDNSSYFLEMQWDNPGRVTGPLPGSGSNRYVLHTPNATEILLVVAFSPDDRLIPITFAGLTDEATDWWSHYWQSGGFVDLSAAIEANKSADASELQRRIILSQYLTAVNSASSNPPQESGLVNNGWYGKFHLEMALWHLLPFSRWGHHDLLARSMPGTYVRFLDSSKARAHAQGYSGARWGKMTDPTGRSAPGEINSLLIWQQPHPMYFAELQYRASADKDTASTLQAWDDVLTATADFMASYAFFNATTGVYDLGPPLYPVAETGNPNATVNPAFELAYWRFGLDIAIRWKQRQQQPVPSAWTTVRDQLAPLPVANAPSNSSSSSQAVTFAVYEGVPDMWTDPNTTTDHPAFAGIYGLLPPPASGPPLDLAVVRNTAATIRSAWDLDDCYGWDFPMLAMNSLRLGDVDQAIAYLLHPVFTFDDGGYPTGGTRVPTPYFPSSSGLLLAVAMMAGGWDEAPGPHFPPDWHVVVDNFLPGL